MNLYVPLQAFVCGETLLAFFRLAFELIVLFMEIMVGLKHGFCFKGLTTILKPTPIGPTRSLKVINNSLINYMSFHMITKKYFVSK